MKGVRFSVFSMCLVLCLGLSGQAANPHDHASMHEMHEALPIPANWTDGQVQEFVANSDALIDKEAGRTVEPGKTIWSEGLPFTKSSPNMTVAQKRKCTWCPKRKMCHIY
jgi:hypothetical protein